MNMENVKSIEDYIEENIRHYYNFSNVINESIQSGCFGPRCIKSTAFNRDALGHAPWNQLHSIKLDGIHCI